MENQEISIQRKRIEAQNKFISWLCMICVMFAVGWSAYAAVYEKAMAAISTNAEDAVENPADTNSSQAEDTSSQADNNTESQPEEAMPDETEHPYAHPTDTADNLSDALFIGDSRTVGLMNSSDQPQASFLCAVGLDIDTVLTSSDLTLGNGSTGNLSQALSEREYGRIYLAFGTNNMGWPYIEVFKEHYSLMVNTIREMQPNASIYCLSILPVAYSQDLEGTEVNNENAVKFSEAIKETALSLGVNYLDCTEAVADENGFLPEDATTDGIHMTSEYCLYWQNFIIDNS